MKLSASILVVLGFVALACAEVYFEEKFLDGKRGINCCWVLAGDDDEKLAEIAIKASIFYPQHLRRQLSQTLFKIYSIEHL